MRGSFWPSDQQWAAIEPHLPYLVGREKVPRLPPSFARRLLKKIRPRRLAGLSMVAARRRRPHAALIPSLGRPLALLNRGRTLLAVATPEPGG